MAGSHARGLAEFVAGASWGDLPAPTIAKAKRHVLDTFGAALAGAASAEACMARAALAAGGGAGATPAWGTDARLPARDAALANGIAAHALELDDTGGCDHSGAVVLPAALAACDLAARPVDGREFLLAVILGYDVGRRVLEAFGGYKPHNAAGWHSTGTCGVFGAAAAAARILGLDAGRTLGALGIAASSSAGIWAFIHDGSMTKRLHAGRAAEGGLLAAILARGGITGPRAVFDDAWGGFLATYARGPVDVDALARDLGVAWRMDIAAIKPYASCRDAHCAIDAIGRLIARVPFSAEDVERVEVRGNDFLVGMVGGKDVSTLPAAQMSLPFAVSARIAFGSAGLSSYSEARRADPRLRALLDRVGMVRDQSIPRSDASVVTVVLRDGRRVDEPTATPLGAPANPLGDDALLAKFHELAGLALPADAARVLAARTMSIEDCTDARALGRMLAPRAFPGDDHG